MAKSRPRRGVILYDVPKQSDIDYLHGQSTQLSYIGNLAGQECGQDGLTFVQES